MERRQLPRSTLSTLIKTVDETGTYLGRAKEIGLSGIMCEIAAEFTKAQPLSISFRLDPKSSPITVKAIPLWSTLNTDGRYIVGFQFIELQAVDKQRISDYIGKQWVDQHLTKEVR